MADDVDSYPQLTPAAWKTLLERKLDEQAKAIAAPMAYYNGVQKLAFATAKFRRAFARYFPPMANNWMKLVVDAPVPKLRILGFRFEPDPARTSWENQADRDAWRIWQANNMDVLSDVAHTEAIKLGVVNLLVTPADEDDTEPVITIEHPGTTYVHCYCGDRRRRLAAIKRWIDDVDGYGHCVVYLPEYVHAWRTADRMRSPDFYPGLTWRREEEEPGMNPLGVVPMVPLENNPDLIYGGRSDLEVAMPIQDAVNKFCLDMQVASEYHAYPQRWATGWERAEDAGGRALTSDQVELFVGLTRILRGAGRDTKFGQFEPGNVENYLKPVEMYVHHLAAVTQTPTYYFTGLMHNLSAEAMQAADNPLDDRAERKTLSFGDGWEEAMRICFLAKGDETRGRAVTAETIWRPIRRLTLSQNADALVKIREGLSVPVEMCWELLGWSPQQIQQARAAMIADERRRAAEQARLLRETPSPGAPEDAHRALMAPGEAGRAPNSARIVVPSTTQMARYMARTP